MSLFLFAGLSLAFALFALFQPHKVRKFLKLDKK
jgi:hypothetical protein